MNNLDVDSIFSISMLLVAATLAVIMLEWMRTHAQHKRHDLRQAKEALEKHFYALDQVLQSPIPNDNVKKLMVQFSTAVNQRSVAVAISRAMLAGERPTLSAGQQAALARILEEIHILANRKNATATRLRDIIGYGFAAMFIRWPETEFAMSDVMVNEARSDVSDKAAWVISEIDDIAAPITPNAVPAFA